MRSTASIEVFRRRDKLMFKSNSLFCEVFFRSQCKAHTIGNKTVVFIGRSVKMESLGNWLQLHTFAAGVDFRRMRE